ncbi:MAG: Os1348 family NHLP clan protein [Terriglobales bacterium]
MSRAALELLLDRWMNDPAFRAAFQADAEGAVRSSGVELDAEEWGALRRLEQTWKDDQLQPRVFKSVLL